MKDFFHIILTGVATGLVAFIGFLPNVHAETRVTDGYLQADTVWSKELGPYILQDVVTVPAGLTLTIHPGVEITLDPDSPYDPYIYVAGKLVLQGTEAEHIMIRNIWGITVDHGQADISFSDFSMKGPLMFGGAVGHIATSTISNMIDGINADGVIIEHSSVGITGSTVQDNLNGMIVKDGGAVFQTRAHSNRLLSWMRTLVQKVGLINTVHAQSADPSSVSISGSRFIANIQHAVRNDAFSIVQAEGNWWGSPEGPMVESRASLETTNSIQGLVSFTPWLDHDPLEESR